MARPTALAILVLLAAAPALAVHDGRFARQDPWQPPNLFDQLQHGILIDIWPGIVLHVAVAVAVNLINNYQTHLYVGIPSTMITVLGTIIGFSISWRTHSAYDRFMEGAHLWGDTIANARNFARLVWFHVPTRQQVVKPPTEQDLVESIIEKKTMINLCIAFHIAMKHYLRGESGPLYEDLYHLTCHLPKYSLPTSIPIVRTDLGPDGNAHHLRQHPSDNELAASYHKTHEKPAEKRDEPAIMLQPPTPATPATAGHGHVPMHHAATIGATAAEHRKDSHHRKHSIDRAKMCDKTDCGSEHPHHARHHHHHLHLSHGGDREADKLTGCVVCLAHDDSGSTLIDEKATSADHPHHHLHHRAHSPTRRATAPMHLDHPAQRPASVSSVNSLLKPPMPGVTTPTLRRTHSHQSSTSSIRPHGPRHPPQPLLPAQNPPRFSWTEDYFPFLAPLKSLWRWLRARTGRNTESAARRDRKNRMRRKFTQSDNLPLEITLYFSAYIRTIQDRGVLDQATSTALLNCLNKFTDHLTALEKVISTPLPLAYKFHLEHAVTIYLLFLPFQLEPILGWTSPLAVGIAAFLFLGFLAIGEAIQSPFGYDRSDLDLDEYCKNIIGRELAEITAHPPASVDQFIFNSTNEPLAPTDLRSAAQLGRTNGGIGLAELEAILRKGHEHDRGWKLHKSTLPEHV